MLLYAVIGLVLGFVIVSMWQQARLRDHVTQLVARVGTRTLRESLDTIHYRQLRERDREVRFLSRACARKNKRIVKLEDMTSKQVQLLNDYDLAFSDLREKIHATTTPSLLNCPVCGDRVKFDGEDKNAALAQQFAEARAKLNSRRLSAGGLGVRV